MSGIAGILHLDGYPLANSSTAQSRSDAEFLEGLTDFQIFRGTDGRNTWCAGPVGFGHTLLSPQLGTSPRNAHEQQPCTLDGQTFIVADARVDARAELAAKLQSHTAGDLRDVTDATLILHAYRVWGERCVEHLLGDFAFAIWDAPKRKLFCARDHIGIKPFFYARLGSLFIFGNTLDCVRLHPGVSGRLNDLFIADFLIFDMPQEQSATAFADIHRLPPAHTLTCENQTVSVRRYWELPAPSPLHYRRQNEYVERFIELLDTAVADRLRTNSVGVLMSGGLDSPTIAASAKRVLTRQGNPGGLRAYTSVFDSLIPHEERRYASLVAQGLNIPIEYLSDDDARIFGKPETDATNGYMATANAAQKPLRHSPEPVHAAWPDSVAKQLRQLSTVSRVALTGFGADPMLSCRITMHFKQLLKSRRFGQALSDGASFLSAEGRFSRLYLRTRWSLFRAPKNQAPSFPPWLNKDFEKKFALQERWAEMNRPPAPRTDFRPEAYASTVSSFWPHAFQSYDPGITGVPVETRHPFFDLRLVSFLLSLPPVPCCSDKELLRDAARSVLPDVVRLRRKSPLSADPLIALLQKPESAWVDRFEPTSNLERYVVRNRIPAVSGNTNSWGSWINLRPLSLDHWLIHNDAASQAELDSSALSSLAHKA